MFSIYNKYNKEVKIYAETIEDEAVPQIYNMTNSPLGKKRQYSDNEVRLIAWIEGDGEKEANHEND